MNVSFTTPVTIEPLQEPTGYHQQWFTLGSCFSEHIGQRLQNAGFNLCANPFGVLFNPLSISVSIRNLIEKKLIDDDELFLNGSLWNHFGFSNLYSGIDKELTVKRMNEQILSASEQFQSAGVLLITFGTSWIFELKDSGTVVANCHKLPGTLFKRRRLSVDEIVKDYSVLMSELPKGMKVIFTVSPVRHWKDGAHENTLSKSVLHLAISELQRLFPDIAYFPAYEIVMDELRDYRFFNNDMIHPSELAIDYIWQQFTHFGFTTDTRSIINEVEQLRQMQNHRPIHPKTVEHRAFIRKADLQKEMLLKRYPFLNL
jgi:hypothetical protein